MSVRVRDREQFIIINRCHLLKIYEFVSSVVWCYGDREVHAQIKDLQPGLDDRMCSLGHERQSCRSPCGSRLCAGTLGTNTPPCKHREKINTSGQFCEKWKARYTNEILARFLSGDHRLTILLWHGPGSLVRWPRQKGLAGGNASRLQGTRHAICELRPSWFGTFF